ncbi:hypothetical protein [Campylobacter fetus]|nr:hypothetical protein [Campylobacter fetus]
MVTKENLAQVLKLLEFKQNGEIFSKTYANDAVIKVDFKNNLSTRDKKRR